jgi:hypothetical protein
MEVHVKYQIKDPSRYTSLHLPPKCLRLCAVQDHDSLFPQRPLQHLAPKLLIEFLVFRLLKMPMISHGILVPEQENLQSWVMLTLLPDDNASSKLSTSPFRRPSRRRKKPLNVDV